jgi:hypothetical protein
MNTRSKGSRGHRKAVEWALNNGYSFARPWVHTKGGKDLWDFADVIALLNTKSSLEYSEAYYFQVKYCKVKPSKKSIKEYHEAIKKHNINPYHCKFLWFKNHVKEPEVLG